MSHVNTSVSAEIRAALHASTEIGSGNFLRHAIATNPNNDKPIITMQYPLLTFYGTTYEDFSLNSLLDASEKYAAWYHGAGVTAKDVVSIYLEDSVAYLVHYFALVSLGAIPALINGNMPLKVAAGFMRRIGSAGVFTDKKRQQELIALSSDTLTFLVTEDDLRGAFDGDFPRLPNNYPYRHDAEDPIMIAHSSGTTGNPKPVLLQHQRFFYGCRYRLGQPSMGPGRMLSSLPHSHNCAIAYIMLALLTGDQIYILSDHTGTALLQAIETWQPTVVVSFPQTFVDLTESHPEKYDTSSVKLWMNGGDAAHETHIRQLLALTEDGRFIDGMGSSEMGFSLFRHVHSKTSDQYDRCVGKPHDWVQAIVVGPDDEEVPAGTIGRLAVRSPSVTTGYWNDSVLTYKSQVRGFWLTGDLAFRDEEGFFFHVDRTPDVIVTARGPLYSLRTEEILMKTFASIADCSVFSVLKDGVAEGRVAVRLKEGISLAVTEAALLEHFNNVLKQAKWPLLSGVDIVKPQHIPLGATGKVLKRQMRDAHMAVAHG